MSVSVAVPNTWADGKRHLWWLGTLPMITPILAGLFALSVGIPALWWSGVVVIFGLIPLIDGLLGEDTSNPPETVVPDLEKQTYYRWIVYSCAVLACVSMVVTAWMAVSGVDWLIGGGLLRLVEQGSLHGSLGQVAVFFTEQAQHHGQVGPFTYLGMAMSTGAATGIAINIAHELGHKPRPLEQFLAKLALAPTFYGHFFVEHNRGHHVRVATPEDPASSRLGESFWRFLPRSTWFSLRSALAPGARAPAQARPADPALEEQRARRLDVQCGAVGRADSLAGGGGDSLPADPGHLRFLPAGGGELRRALRPVAPEAAQWPL